MPTQIHTNKHFFTLQRIYSGRKWKSWIHRLLSVEELRSNFKAGFGFSNWNFRIKFKNRNLRSQFATDSTETEVNKTRRPRFEEVESSSRPQFQSPHEAMCGQPPRTKVLPQKIERFDTQRYSPAILSLTGGIH